MSLSQIVLAFHNTQSSNFLSRPQIFRDSLSIVSRLRYELGQSITKVRLKSEQNGPINTGLSLQKTKTTLEFNLRKYLFYRKLYGN